MNGALVYIVAEPHHEITNVDHDRAFDWRGLDPLAFAVQNLQATDHILPQ